MSNGTYTGYYSSLLLSYNPATLTATGTVSDSSTGVAVSAGIAGQRFVNYGTITAAPTTAYGVLLASGGLVINGAAGNTSAVIDGGFRGIDIAAAGTVVNHAAITGTHGDGVVIAQRGTVINNGTIDSVFGVGVGLSDGGVVTNGQVNAGALLIGNNYGVFVGGAAGTVANYGTIEGTTFFAGVALREGGFVSNAATGVIGGYTAGVYLDGAAGTLINSGLIAGYGDVATGVLLAAGGQVVNSAGGVISGYSRAVYFQNQPATLVNGGTLVGTGVDSDAVVLLAGGFVTNDDPNAVIEGAYAGVVVVVSAGTAVNSGLIEATLTANASPLIGVDLGAGGVASNYGTIVGGGTYSRGVQLGSGGTVSNIGSGAVIVGYTDGVYISAGAGSVINAGTMAATGTASLGVALLSGGYVSNSSAGLIEGGHFGIYVSGAVGSIANYGSIAASGAAGVGVSLTGGGTVVNGPSGATGGLITGTYGVRAGASLSLTNYGTISGTFEGIDSPSGEVINGPSGAIGALVTGSFIAITSPSSVNYGTITGGVGLLIQDVTNHSSGVISASGYGVWALAVAGTMTNYGMVIGGGSSPGVLFTLGGYVDNAAGGTITGGTYGLDIKGAAGSVVNAGTISGTAAASRGIQLAAGGSVTNTSLGLISSQYRTVEILGTRGEIVNFGTIIGDDPSTNSANSTTTMLRQGGVLINGASDDTAALISGEGYSQGAYFGNFRVSYTNAAGTIVNYGTIANQRYAGIVMSQGGTVDNLGSIVSPDGEAMYIRYGYVSNSGLISADFDGVRSFAPALGNLLTVVNQATIASVGTGIGVHLQAGGAVTNSGAAALIAGYGYGVAVASGSGTVVNSGTIDVSGISGTAIYLAAGGAISNSGLLESGLEGGAGLKIDGGGLATNTSAGLIVGASQGVSIGGAAGTVVNYGTIAGGSLVDGIDLNAGGAVVNGTAGVTTALITGGYLGVYVAGAGSILNYGTIAATGAGGHGMRIAGAATIDNLGTIAGPGSGLSLDTSGLIINGESGSTAGLIIGGDGLSANGGAAPSTVVNYGTIAGEGSGAVLFTSGGTVISLGTIIDTGTAANGIGITSGGVVVNGRNGGPPSLIEAANYAISLNNVSATVTNYGTVIAGHVAIDANAPLVEIANFGTVIGTTGFGVYVATGGTATNHGLILGYAQGVDFAVVDGTLVNYGTVAGTAALSDAVVMYGGVVVNSAGGLLTGPGYAVEIGPGAGTVINYGTIITTGSNNTPLRLTGGGMVDNSGFISGTGNGDGVFLDTAATVTNAGTIIGRSGVDDAASASTPALVVNYGQITGTTGNGVYQIGGGVTNTVSGVITGYADAVVIASSAGVVENLGTIEEIGSTGFGVELGAGGTVANYGVILGTGTAYPDGVYLADGGVLDNFGTITASADLAVNLPFGGTVENQANALLQGYEVVVVDGPNGGTVDNYGTIAGSSEGVGLKAPHGIVFNAAVIIGTGLDGVYLYGGGTATNTSTGYIAGYRAIIGNHYPGTVSNYGTIVGLSGNGVGVVLQAPASTLVNAGTIIGSAASVDFVGGANLLAVDPGAVFVGNVYGGGAANDVLELAVGSTAGSITGLGTQFTGFDQIVVDSRAVWQATGSNTIDAGVTLSDAGTLTFVNPLTAYGDLYIGAGATLTLAQGANGGGDIVFARANGVLGIGGATMPTNTISAIAPGDAIDLSGLTWSAGASASYIAASQQLLVYAGGLVDTLSVTGVVAGTQFQVVSDSQGGAMVEAFGAGGGSYFAGNYTSGIVLRNPGLQNPATIGPNGYVTNSSGSYFGDGVYGTSATAWTLINYGTVNATGGTSEGVRLMAGGEVINGRGTASSSLIKGFTNGIDIEGGPATVANYGTVTGGAEGDGVFLQAGGALANGQNGATGALIAGGDVAVQIGYHGAGAGTVSNFAQIAGTNVGVYLAAGGTVTNGASGSSAALISGYFDGVEVASAGGSVSNFGVIVGSGASGDGVRLIAGGYVDNFGLITATFEAVEIDGAPAVVTNYGTVEASGTNGAGVRLLAGGDVTNASGAYINGPANGINVNGATGTVLNLGSIGNGIYLTDGGYINNQGNITGLVQAIAIGHAVGTVVNSGGINGNGTNAGGIYLTAGGGVTNAQSGIISGSVIGIEIGAGTGNAGIPGTVVNLGTIDGGSNTGVWVAEGGVIVNGQPGVAGALITAGADGAVTGYQSTGGVGSVVNYGTIVGPNVAVFLEAGGVVTNAGLISGGAGIDVTVTAGIVDNYGTAIGTVFDAVYLREGGSVVNGAGALLQGADYGVHINTAAGTIVNLGEIASITTGTTGRAVELGDGGFIANYGLIIGGHVPAPYYPGAITALGAVATVLNIGTVASTNGGDGVDLVAGGTIVNGTTGSTTALITAGHFGIYTGGNTGTANGIGGVINNYGTITAQRNAVVLESGGTVVNERGGEISSTSDAIVVQGNAGTINNFLSSIASQTGHAIYLGAGGYVGNSGDILTASTSHAAVSFHNAVGAVYNTGTIISVGNQGIYFQDGGSVTNPFQGLIVGGADGIAVLNATGTVFNAGTIDSAGITAGAAIYFAQGGLFTNDAGLVAAYRDGIVAKGGASTVTTYGFIRSYGNDFDGVYLGAGGLVSNVAGSEIESHWDGINLRNVAGVVDNLGDIVSTANFYNPGGASGSVAGVGVILQQGGELINGAAGTFGGYISAYAFAVYGGGAAGTANPGAVTTVVNYGTIQNTGTSAVVRPVIELSAGGTIENFGTIESAAGNAIDISGTVAATIQNFGLILNFAGIHAAIYSAAGGLVTNAAGALIASGKTGIAFNDTIGTTISFGSVVNAGMVESTGTGAGVYFGQGGLLTNQAGASITAVHSGVRTVVDPATVVNYGAIQSTGANYDGVALGAGGLVVNSGGINGGADGIYAAGVATVVNTGDIAGQGGANTNGGVVLQAGGLVVNGAGGVVQSQWDGAHFVGAGTLDNSGSVIGDGIGASGIAMLAGGYVNNAAGALLTGGNGLYGGGGAMTIVNAGTIAGTGTAGGLYGIGVALGFGSVVTNDAGASITGSVNGVRLTAAAVVVNFGTIAGNAVGVDMLSGAAGSTVVNAGTIIGAGGTALSFNGAGNLLVLDPGATFAGNVDGGGAGTDLLELTGVGGYIAGLGSQFTGFDQIAVYQGAVWTATGANTVGGGTMLTDDGVLTFVNAVTDDGSVAIGAAATLTLASGANGGGDIAFVGADGLLAIGGTAMPGNTISGFAFGDVIDLQNVAGGGSGNATLEAGNVLQVVEGGQSFFLQFDPTQNFAGDSFVLTGDSGSGTEILLTTTSATVVSAGETLTVSAGEVLSNVIVLAGGTLDVAAGGTVVDTQIAAGGTEIVEAGGLDVSATVDSGGFQDIFGSATLDLVLGGGSQTIEVGGVAFDAVLDGAAVQTVFGVASNSTVSAGDSLVIESGGTAGGATIDAGGSEIVSAGGTADTTLVFAGGVEIVSAGGNDVNAVIAGGTEQVFGSASNAIVVSGGAITIEAGGLVNGAQIDAAGTLELAAGSTATGILDFGSVGGDLQIDGTTMPTAPISGFALGDTIDLRGIGFVAGMSATFDPNTDALTITGGASDVQLTLTGIASGTQFDVVSDGQGGTDILETSAAGNLIVNGGFEESSSNTTTPPGWTNIGHEDGVIAYAQFPQQPVYQGAEFYDLGGFGEPQPPVGDGIEQTVATTTGDTYTLTFGMSQENQSGTEILQVSIGGQITDYTLIPTGTGVFTDPFTTETIQYVATGSATTIAFTIADNSPSTGSNDPLIDGVSFTQASGPPPANLFSFIFTYSDGKSYYDGVVADNGSFGYFVGQRINTSAGSYQIIQNLGMTSYASGAVVVTSYSYNQPGEASPVPLDTAEGLPDGIAGLGSESDSVLGTDGQEHAFSSTHEATFAATPLFSFVYSYNDGNFYAGTVADDGTFGVAPGTRTIFNSVGAVVGTYTIFADGTTAEAPGAVTVNSLVLDGQSFVPTQSVAGTNGLGSEFGTVSVNGQSFGFSDQSEPDVVPSISTAPVSIPPNTNPIDAEVDQIFSDLLARAPSNSELANYSAMIAAGTTTTTVRQGLETPGSEGQNDLNQVFQQIFNQSIDPNDDTTYTNLLIDGSSLAAVQLMLAQSAQAVAQIEALYEQDFNQPISPELLASMEGILGDSGGSMNEVADILSSSSAAQAALDSMFTAATARSPDAAELAGMEAQVTNGASETTLQAALITDGSAGGYSIAAAPSGNAVLTAQPGIPTQFVFDNLGFGIDTVAGFDASTDAIELPQSLAPNFAALQALMSATSNGTLITFSPTQSILIEGVAPGSLTGSNFYLDESAGSTGGTAAIGINMLPYALAPGADFFSDGTVDPLWRDASTGDVLLWNFAPGYDLYASETLGVAPSGWALQGAADFTGDGGASILWRDASTGDVSLWNPAGDGGLAYTVQDLGLVGLNWTIEGAADFTGDGKASILWRDANTGDVQLWTSNPGNAVSFGIQDLGVVGWDWQIAGIGSFTGNGLADILWRNSTSGDTQIWAYNPSTGTFSARDLGISGLNWKLLGIADFNGDGTSDILWQNSATGDVVLWDSGPGGSPYTAQDLGVVGPEWTFLSAGDYSGNGEADILWQNASGDVTEWASSPPPPAFSPQSLGSVSPQWNAAATGDFSANGMTDIVWRNAVTGDVSVWSANPGSQLSFASIDAGYASLNWTIAGTGDFTGNGGDDILWRDGNSGDVQLWNASTAGGGTPSFTTQDLGLVGADWTIEGAGDFTGDGKASILWLNTASGDVSLWQSNSGSGVSFTPEDLGPVGPGWTYEAAGDFTGNGSDGILWHNASSGDLSLWESTPGSSSFTPQDLGIVSPDWTFEGVSDFNGDGKADILWQNTATGELNLWESNPGAGVSFTIDDLGTAPQGQEIVQVGDFNGSGRAGILWEDSAGNLSLWNQNAGSPSFTAHDLGIMTNSI